MKHRIAHIINPFTAPDTSDLKYAQPISFESMRLAREKAAGYADVELLATCFKEDEAVVPAFIRKTSFLQRSVLDQATFNQPIKYPLIAEILEKAITESNAEFIIYSNVDIGVYPDFYLRVNELLDQGFDAAIINRKRIKPLYTSPADLEKIYAQEGKSHPGFDCFIFHRSLFEKMELGNICIGVPFIEISFSQNLFHLAHKFKLVPTGNYTFHIGMEIFKRRAPKEYLAYNRNEYKKLIKKLEPVLKSRNLPFSNQLLPLRIIRWGLHPCIPIRLALQLELKKWMKV